MFKSTYLQFSKEMLSRQIAVTVNTIFPFIDSQILSERDNETVIATLSEGRIFGEVSRVSF